MSKKTDPAKTDEPVVGVPDPEQTKSTTDKRTCIFAVNTRRGLNLRPEPSKDSDPTAVLPYQAVVIATGEAVSVGADEWLPVRTISGARGFVMLEHLDAVDINEEDT